MEILHFKDLGDTESVITNAVVLVFGVSNLNSNVPPRGYLPSYKVVLQCILGNLQYFVIAEGQMHTHTDRQPQYNSFATVSRLN